MRRSDKESKGKLTGRKRILMIVLGVIAAVIFGSDSRCCRNCQ